MMLPDLYNFHFLRPSWLWAILPMLFLLFALLRSQKKNSTWEKVCDPRLLSLLWVENHGRYQKKMFILLFLVWLVIILVLAGPAWSRMSVPVFFSKASRVIILDLSRSMLATDIKPNRITRARFKILDMLSMLSSGQTGLVVFAGESYDVAPLTFDHKTLAAFIPQLTPELMPVNGGNISAGLQKARRMMLQAGSPSGNIILITDNKPDAYDFAVAKQLAREGFHTSILGVGTSNQSSESNINFGVPFDPASLKKLAISGGGNYATFTSNNQDIHTLMRPLLWSEQNFETNVKKFSANRWYDEGRWLLLCILPIVLMIFRRGWLELLW